MARLASGIPFGALAVRVIAQQPDGSAVSFDPFIARSIRIYGHAVAPFERVGMVGPGIYMRITPTISWSWNMAGEPRRATHQVPGDKLDATN